MRSSTLLFTRMHIVNCHQNTEAADLLGGLRPLRGRDKLVSELRQRARCFLQRCHVAGAVHGHENDGAVRDSSFAEKLDVAGIMIIVQVSLLCCFWRNKFYSNPEHVDNFHPLWCKYCDIDFLISDIPEWSRCKFMYCWKGARRSASVQRWSFLL